MRILVTGGRSYADRDAVWSALDRVHAKRGLTCVIHGAATGADEHARAWCIARRIPMEVYPANWRPVVGGGIDRSAGPRRNADMLERGRPDGVVAFPGGTGTADMVRRAEAAGIKVWRPTAA